MTPETEKAPPAAGSNDGDGSDATITLTFETSE